MNALLAMRTPPITARSEGECQAERPKQNSQAKPQTAACTATLRHKSRADSAEDPDNYGKYYLLKRDVPGGFGEGRSGLVLRRTA
jgi:hypothetical protein